MPDRRALLIYVALAAAVLALGVRQLRAGGSPSAGAEQAVPAATTTPAVAEREDAKRVVVHVAGRVRRPGVYRLPAGARVDDAVRRAGGVRAGADLTAVNLAAEVEDGRQIVVPAAAGGTPAAAGGAPGAAAAPLNLNTATVEQLQELDGIGPGLAGKIVAHREEHGGFGSVRELGDVPGIGEKRLAAIEEHVTA